MERPYTVFTHVLDEAEHIWGQMDTQPVNGTYPTTMWQPGEVVEDEYLIPFLSPPPDGAYSLAVGLYSLETMERLPVFGKEGDVGDTRVLLPSIRITSGNAQSP
jgi:hypothetical protein